MTEKVLTMIGGLALLGLLAACQFPPTAPTPPCVVVGVRLGHPDSDHGQH